MNHPPPVPLPVDPARIQLRTATPDDLRALRALFAQLGYPASEKLFNRRLEEVLSDPRQVVLVAATPAGTAVAAAHVARIPLLEADGFAQLLALVVDEASRSAGIGTRLVLAAEEWARSNGALFLGVRSNVVRTRAHRLYDRLGYERVKTQVAFRKDLALATGPHLQTTFQ